MKTWEIHHSKSKVHIYSQNSLFLEKKSSITFIISLKNITGFLSFLLFYFQVHPCSCFDPTTPFSSLIFYFMVHKSPNPSPFGQHFNFHHTVKTLSFLRKSQRTNLGLILTISLNYKYLRISYLKLTHKNIILILMKNSFKVLWFLEPSLFFL